MWPGAAYVTLVTVGDMWSDTATTWADSALVVSAPLIATTL